MPMVKVVDKALFNAGPIFIVIAFGLVDMCVLAYYLVVFPYSHQWASDEDAGFVSRLLMLLNILFTLYMVYCIHFHYYMAIKTPPGSMKLSHQKSQDDDSSRDTLLGYEEQASYPKTCKKCQLPKPERAHHCSVCNECVLRFDHHCPWIHNCVGHYNHRYFLLFMTYMVLSATYFVAFGWRPFIVSLDLALSEWPYYYPRPLMAFSFILAICMGVAIMGLCSWHYYLVMTGQTTVEFYNNYYEMDVARNQGEIFINMYDFGYKENLKHFFNIGEKYPWYTVFYPIPIPPKGDGRVFEKCQEFYLLPETQQHDHLMSQQAVQDLEDIKDL
ncbi:DHHC palmitoyltransferase-domain-containing protein [Gongronella butleri]|nr:DHHC palmitoyltransferase-domain-containing protein [Gongronella butleri]